MSRQTGDDRPGIELFDKPECPFCFKVRIALAEQDRPYRHRPHDDPAVEAERERLSPTGTVPILVEGGGRVLTESAVIMEYLAETGPGLMPDDAWERARARSIAHFSDNRVGRAVREVIFEKRDRPAHEWDRARIDAGVAAWRGQCLPYLADALGDRAFFAGVYSIADAALTARFALAHAYGMDVPVAFPNLRAWFARMTDRASFAPAAPPKVRECLSAAAG
ncbi:glutathione S-transferase family protein [Arhodomonas aquaeolei]|uniref:glutathione S-transferase family protein n=1 Tax=Arhodomonas aquaeolei TaxID=2369 RepID=UPI00037EAB41|nr:glutathione S-transferase family protein [Arhodomonas aquaeolei]